MPPPEQDKRVEKQIESFAGSCTPEPKKRDIATPGGEGRHVGESREIDEIRRRAKPPPVRSEALPFVARPPATAKIRVREAERRLREEPAVGVERLHRSELAGTRAHDEPSRRLRTKRRRLAVRRRLRPRYDR